MNNIVVADSHRTNGAGLHSGMSSQSGFEFHIRLLVCWLYGFLFAYRCIRGQSVRLLFDPERVPATVTEEIPPGKTNSATAVRAKRIESLWSEMRLPARLLVAPLYSAYIIGHSIAGTRIHFMYAPDESCFLSSEEYSISKNSVIVQTRLC